MILSDRDIRKEIHKKRLKIEPLTEGALQPASVDLHLGDTILSTLLPPIPGPNRFFQPPPTLRPFSENWIPPKPTMQKMTPENPEVILEPGQLVLGTTIEYVKIPNHLVGRLEGKSSLGRIWLMIHCTSGFIDPGFEGQLTLEISNLSPFFIALYTGMPIAQISFLSMSSPPTHSYGDPALHNHYQRQTGPTPARFSIPIQEPRT